MRQSRRPFISILILFIVACAIYYVASGDSVSLGESTPLSIKKTPKVETQAELSFEVEEAPKQDIIRPETESLQVGEFTETPFMPKMANETLKAQLGNSAWHLLHVVLARYPDKPTEQERNTLKQYIHLFGQIYPCGDCARHFQKLLKKFPPQVSSRKTAALWGCHIHNQVNKRLEKPEYDCTNILEDYDCGCGSDEQELDFTLGNTSLDHLREVKVDEKGGQQGG